MKKTPKAHIIAALYFLGMHDTIRFLYTDTDWVGVLNKAMKDGLI